MGMREFLGEVLSHEIITNDERLFIASTKEVEEMVYDEIPMGECTAYVATLMPTVDNSKLPLTRKPLGTKIHFDYDEGDEEHKTYLQKVTRIFNPPNKFATHYIEESTWKSSLGEHRQAKTIIVDKQIINMR